MNFTNYDTLIGAKFGRLTIISEGPSHPRKNGRKLRQCYCNCDCGTTDFLVPYSYLIRGINKSCGCLVKEKIGRGNKKKGECKK